MNEAERRAQIRRYWEDTAGDQDVIHEIYHDDAVLDDGGPGQPAVNILEFRATRWPVETIYVTEAWDAPEWRAQWRAAP